MDTVVLPLQVKCKVTVWNQAQNIRT